MQDTPHSALHLSVLGPFSLSAAPERLVQVRGEKVRALLVYLAVETAVHRREELMALLWPELELTAAQSNLRQTLYRLRRAVPDVRPRAKQASGMVPLFVADRASARLNPEAEISVDVHTFQRLLGEVRRHDHPTLHACRSCLERLEQAAALYRGDFLVDLFLAESNPFEEWAGSLRANLREAALALLRELTEAHLDAGRASDAEPWARRQLQLDPLRESAYRQLMTSLAEQGRKSEALALFEECRTVLAEELQTRPSAETLALYERIQEGDFDSAVQPGIRLREYIIMEELSGGSFGSIYRAYQPSVEREVAIKVIHPRYANQPEFMRRLETEARFVARLEHPHIVPLYDYWRDASGAHLVMRWLRRGSLEKRLEGGPLEIEDTLRLLNQIVAALTETHKQGIVHRDLKPGNILLDDQGNVYLTDFGIAKDLDVDTALTKPGTIVGSPAYMAPEQLRSEAVTPQTDIYSLGIILFETLTGRRPFRAGSIAALIQQHLNEPLPPVLALRPELPPAVDWVLGRATAKRPDQRYERVSDLGAALQEAFTPATFAAAPTNSLRTGAQRLRLVAHHDLSLLESDKRAFVGRQRQLDRLQTFLQDTLNGFGRIIFVTGGSGRGKTTLLHEFAHRAMDEVPGLLFAAGSCSIYSAAGDPYLPFRQILSTLTADTEAQVRAGLLSPEHGRRLRAALPVTARAVVEKGGELLDVLVSAQALKDRLEPVEEAGTTLTDRLRILIEAQRVTGAQQERKRLFSQFTGVLQDISRVFPLILVLDDLQWVDAASASLLHHLSQNLSGQRLLIIGAYRREEVAMGRDGERHPLDKVLAEVKSAYGSIAINLAELDQSEEWQFVNMLLDQQVNEFSEQFRRALFDHTSGHALFTVELLRAMRERGDVKQNEEGKWVDSRSIDWSAMPPRVEGVIEERVGRLNRELRALLNTACVEGELFTAEVLARIEERDPRELLHLLSSELEDVHRLVKEQDEIRLGEQFLTRFRFSHALIQQYLYARLGSGERRLLHAKIAETLEELIGDQWPMLAAEMAFHWHQADRPDRALRNWLWLGDRARVAGAHPEAENYYKRGVAELRQKGEVEAAARTLMKLGLVYTASFQPDEAQAAYDLAFSLWRPAHEMVRIEQEAPGNVLLRLATELPVTFDPGRIDDDVSTFMATQLFNGLVRVGQDQNVMPAVAERWEVLDGGTRYLFYVRHDAKWSDGTPLTAEDFVLTWRRNLHPQTKSTSAHLLYVLRNARDFAEGMIDDAEAIGLRALDETRLEISLEKPTAYLPYLLAHTVAFPLPRWLVENDSIQWDHIESLISNGPYKVDKSLGAKLTLTRNTCYWGQFTGNIQQVEFTFSDDYEAHLRAYSQDELDVVNLIHADPDTIGRAGSMFGKELMSIPRWSTFYLCFRCDRPPFNDRRVRQAFAYALDRVRLADEVFQGYRRAATGGFVPPGMPGHSPGIALRFDPPRGRELLAEAGFESGQAFPEVEWLASPGGERLIRFMQRAWQQNLNVDLSPRVLAWEALMKKFNQDPAPLTILAWGADIPDPENMLRTTFHSRQGMGIPRWHNEAFNALTDKAELVTDHGQRMALYRQADQILVAEETAVLPLSYALGRLLVKPWVKLPVMPAISMSLRFATVVAPGP